MRFQIAVSVMELDDAFTSEEAERIQEEYTAVEGQSKLYPILTAVKPENSAKNRTLGTAAYDHTRVHLDSQPGQPDYINASHVDGYFRTNDMIIAQGPTKTTARDFWGMIWDQNVTTIAMVTQTFENDKSLCLRYWPDVVGGGLRYGALTIILKSRDPVEGNQAIVKKVMTVTNQVATRTIVHFQYVGWPDGKVPSNTIDFLTFFVSYRESHREAGAEGPILLHGSRGAGRAGVCALFDVSLYSALDKGYVNLPKALYLLRRQRSHLVGSLAQYTFVYSALVELFSQRGDVNTTPAPANMFMYEILGRWELELEEAKRQEAANAGIVLDAPESDHDLSSSDNESEVGNLDSSPLQEARPMKAYTDAVYKPPTPDVPEAVISGVLSRVFSSASVALQAEEDEPVGRKVTLDTSNGKKLGMRLEKDPATGMGLAVIALVPGGQAELSGQIYPGDVFTHINGINVTKMSLADIIGILKSSTTLTFIIAETAIYDDVHDIGAALGETGLYGPGNFPEPELPAADQEFEAVLMPINERIGALAESMQGGASKRQVDTHSIDVSKARRARASFLVNEEEAMAVSNDVAAQKAAKLEAKKQAALLLEQKRVEKERLAEASRKAHVEKEQKRIELEAWKKKQAAAVDLTKKKQSTREQWKSQFANR